MSQQIPIFTYTAGGAFKYGYTACLRRALSGETGTGGAQRGLDFQADFVRLNWLR